MTYWPKNGFPSKYANSIVTYANYRVFLMGNGPERQIDLVEDLCTFAVFGVTN